MENKNVIESINGNKQEAEYNEKLNGQIQNNGYIVFNSSTSYYNYLESQLF